MYLALAAAVIITVIVFIDNIRMKEDIEVLELKIKDLKESLEHTKHFVKLYAEESVRLATRCKDCKEEEPYWKPGICTNCPYHEDGCDGCDRCIVCEYDTIEVPDNYDEYYGEDDQEEEEEEEYTEAICDLNCNDCSGCKEELDPSHFTSPCDDCELGPCREDMPCERFINWKASFYPKHVTFKCLTCDEFGKLCVGCQACGQCNIDGSCPEDGSVCTEKACGFTAVDCVADECDHHCERR